MAKLEDKIEAACDAASAVLYGFYRLAPKLTLDSKFDADAIRGVAELILYVLEAGQELSGYFTKEVEACLGDANPYPAWVGDGWAESYTGAAYYGVLDLRDILQVGDESLAVEQIIAAWPTMRDVLRDSFSSWTDDYPIHLQKECTRALRICRSGASAEVSPPPSPRYRPDPCPECDGTTKVQSTKPRIRNLKCKECGHAFKRSR